MDFYSFLYRKVSDAPLRNIEDITYDVKGYMAALFNYGDVTIQTAAERREFDFASVPNPSRVADILSDLVKEIRKKTEGMPFKPLPLPSLLSRRPIFFS